MQKVAVVALDKLLAVGEATEQKSKLRPVFRMLHFKDDYVEGTDGFMIIRLKLDNPVEKEWLVNFDTLKRARAIQLSDQIPATIYEDKVEVAGGEVMTYAAEDVGRFPNAQQIVKAVPKDSQSICLSVKLLERVIRSAKKLGVERLIARVAVEPTRKNTLQMMVIDSEDAKFKAIVMPIIE